MSVGRATLPLSLLCTPPWMESWMREKAEEKAMYLCPLVCHGEIEFIFISLSNLLLETGETILLGVIVSCAFDIVSMFLEEPELCPVGELGALLVVAPVD